ncbi:hypothetical protein BV25DRAFT_1921644 [Artomyces pyxidatus]|uniref:Uncharacterized protein n=1 Tax=Artomyces pyxidatus TaxID=48021 RepID=A0ACB8SGX2_9AGAM|nr:hypothetical protein BV25DRAFT_1921644 [Artomyces pyxidatus]
MSAPLSTSTVERTPALFTLDLIVKLSSNGGSEAMIRTYLKEVLKGVVKPFSQCNNTTATAPESLWLALDRLRDRSAEAYGRTPTPASTYQAAMELLQSGFRPTTCCHLLSTLRRIVKTICENFVSEPNVEIAQSSTVRIIPDPVDVLDEGQVYFNPAPVGDIHSLAVTGSVLIIASSIQKAVAVEDERLGSFTNTVVVSRKGSLPLSDYLVHGEKTETATIIWFAPIVESFCWPPVVGDSAAVGPAPRSRTEILHSLAEDSQSICDDALRQMELNEEKLPCWAGDVDLFQPYLLVQDCISAGLADKVSKAMQEELDRVLAHVIAFKREFDTLATTIKHELRDTAVNYQHASICSLAKSFAAGPDDVPLLSALHSLPTIRASSAYHYSMAPENGRDPTFAFAMAFAELCRIKVEAAPAGSIVYYSKTFLDQWHLVGGHQL